MIEFDLDQCFLAISYLYENASRDVHPVLLDRHQYWGIDVHMYGIGDPVDYTEHQLNMVVV
jgi:hypothetical protein